MKLLLIQTALAGFTTFGCYRVPTELIPPSVQIDQQTAENCANKCLELPTSYSIMSTVLCACTNSTLNFFQQNAAECNDKCVDGSPCGGNGRLSLYELSKPVNPTVVVPSPSPTNPAGQIDNANIGKGDSINQKQIALYASLGAAIIVVGIGIVLFVRYKRKQSSIPTLPRHGGKKYLIPHLPQTTNLVYSVHTPYQPKRHDEIILRKDDVVCLQSYDGEWGQGTNVTTGERGYVPLACFLDNKFEIHIPSRF